MEGLQTLACKTDPVRSAILGRTRDRPKSSGVELSTPPRPVPAVGLVEVIYIGFATLGPTARESHRRCVEPGAGGESQHSNQPRVIGGFQRNAVGFQNQVGFSRIFLQSRCERLDEGLGDPCFPPSD